MIDFKLINEVFPDYSDVRNHNILVRDGKTYKTADNSGVLQKNKIDLGSLLSSILIESQKKERTDTELKKALNISQYFIQKYDDVPSPVPKHFVIKKIEAILSRIINWMGGNGFKTNLEIAREIQKTVLAHQNFKIEPRYDWFPSDQSKSSAITYSFDPSYTRFGDNFREYLKGKYLSNKFGVPFLYKPFEYSEQLLATEKYHYLDAFRDRFKRIVICNSILDLAPLKHSTQQSTLYVLSYWGSFEEYNSDPAFKVDIQKCIKIKSNALPVKTDRISVALHFRAGGGFKHDTDSTKKRMPTKFPPISYYLEALKKVLEIYQDQSFDIHLFTDSTEPESIIKQLRNTFPENKSLKFSYRNADNKHDANVLEDFIEMTKYKVLIRPDSSYSYTAASIGESELVIHPKQWGQTIEKNGEIGVEFIVEDKRMTTK